MAVMVSCVASFKSLFSFCKQSSQDSYYYYGSNSSVGTAVLGSGMDETQNERKWGDDELGRSDSVLQRADSGCETEHNS